MIKKTVVLLLSLCVVLRCLRPETNQACNCRQNGDYGNAMQVAVDAYMKESQVKFDLLNFLAMICIKRRLSI